VLEYRQKDSWLVFFSGLGWQVFELVLMEGLSGWSECSGVGSCWGGGVDIAWGPIGGIRNVGGGLVKIGGYE